MKYSQVGFISPGIMTLLVGGLALGGLLVYGSLSGQQLPLWPAIAVALVNVLAAARLVFEVKARRRGPNASAPGKPQKQK